MGGWRCPTYMTASQCGSNRGTSPTQITVGMREVEAKRKRWREEGDTKGAEFLGEHLISVILGPTNAIMSLIITILPWRFTMKASRTCSSRSWRT